MIPARRWVRGRIACATGVPVIRPCGTWRQGPARHVLSRTTASRSEGRWDGVPALARRCEQSDPFDRSTGVRRHWSPSLRPRGIIPPL